MGTLLAVLLLQTQVDVDAAVKKGLEHVKREEGELVLWTLVRADVSERDPDLKRLLDDALRAPPASTTSAALQAMVLEDLERVKYRHRIAHCAQQLVDTQCGDGLWDLGRAVEAPALPPPPPAPGPKAVAPPAGKPAVRLKIKLERRADGGETGSPDLAIRALWGLLAAHEAGVIAPAEVVERAARPWREGTRDAAATVSALSTCGYLSGKNWRKDSDVLKAVERLKAEKRTSPKEIYVLKVAMLHFGAEVSPIDVKAFLAAQRPDGSWGDLEATCYGVLMLNSPRRL